MIRRARGGNKADEQDAMPTAPDALRRDNLQSGGFNTILLRTVGWGTAAALALGVAVFTAQTQSGTERIQLALTGAPAAQIAAVAVKQSDPAVAVLQAKLERLTIDRDRLEARLASLEHGLDDITGSIRSQSEARSSALQVGRTNPPIIEPPLIPALETLPLTPKAVPPKAEEPAAPTAAAPATAAASGTTEPPKAEAFSEPQSEVTTAPARVAALPAPAKRAAEFGIELGNAADMAALQSRWVGIKANYGPLLAGLSPVAVKEKRAGHTGLRLIAGPVKSMAAARELCAKFALQNGYCFPRQVDPAEIVQR
jgi:pyruvate/2-oxoglutarate dehydrogenase complex dihydrolipoamide acyltransferase (E2) component